jgi:hypothetical protein
MLTQRLQQHAKERAYPYSGDTYERWAQMEGEFGDRNRRGDLLHSAETEYNRVEHIDFRQSLVRRLDKLRIEMGLKSPTESDQKSDQPAN